MTELVKKCNKYFKDKGKELLLLYSTVISEIRSAMPWKVCPKGCSIVVSKYTHMVIGIYWLGQLGEMGLKGIEILPLSFNISDQH